MQIRQSDASAGDAVPARHTFIPLRKGVDKDDIEPLTQSSPCIGLAVQFSISAGIALFGCESEHLGHLVIANPVLPAPGQDFDTRGRVESRCTDMLEDVRVGLDDDVVGRLGRKVLKEAVYLRAGPWW